MEDVEVDSASLLQLSNTDEGVTLFGRVTTVHRFAETAEKLHRHSNRRELARKGKGEEAPLRPRGSRKACRDAGNPGLASNLKASGTPTATGGGPPSAIEARHPGIAYGSLTGVGSRGRDHYS